MVDIGPGSILNLDAGISRVIWDAPPGQLDNLPDRRQLPPSELAATQQLNRLLLADNVDAAVARAMRPSVGSPDVLQPDRFEAALRVAGRVIERAMPSATGEAQAALQGLGDVLREQNDLQSGLNYYRDMLIAG